MITLTEIANRLDKTQIETCNFLRFCKLLDDDGNPTEFAIKCNMVVDIPKDIIKYWNPQYDLEITPDRIFFEDDYQIHFKGIYNYLDTVIVKDKTTGKTYVSLDTFAQSIGFKDKTEMMLNDDMLDAWNETKKENNNKLDFRKFKNPTKHEKE